MSSWFNVAAGTGLAGLAAGIAIGYCFGTPSKDEKNEAETFFDVLFFPDSKIEKFGDLNKQERVEIFKDVLYSSPSLQKMKDYLSSAEKRSKTCPKIII